MSFRQDTSKTYRIVERSFWDKRFCSLNICFHPRGKQHCLVIIFHGKGKGIKEVDRLMWILDADVYLQVSTWADTEFCIEWVEKMLALIMKETCHYVEL